jgi:hypothetical protein
MDVTLTTNLVGEQVAQVITPAGGQDERVRLMMPVEAVDSFERFAHTLMFGAAHQRAAWDEMRKCSRLTQTGNADLTWINGEITQLAQRFAT